MKWLAILNPTSAAGRSLKRFNQMKPYLNRLKIDFDEIKTDYIFHGIELAKQGIDDGYDGIISVGGDGTTHEIFNGILTSKNKRTPLAILPTGTGNDMPNAIGLPLPNQKDGLKLACKIIASGLDKPVDVGKITSVDFNGEKITKFFCGVLSFGFDAEVTFATNNMSKRLPGTLNYLKSLISGIFVTKPRKYKIRLLDQDKDVEHTFYQVAIGNGAYYGGGMKICPQASIRDGKFQIMGLTNEMTKIKLISAFGSVYSGDHIKYPEVKLYETSKLTIKTELKTLWQADGEVLGTTPAKVECLPDKLLIRQKS